VEQGFWERMSLKRATADIKRGGKWSEAHTVMHFGNLIAGEGGEVHLYISLARWLKGRINEKSHSRARKELAVKNTYHPHLARERVTRGKAKGKVRKLGTCQRYEKIQGQREQGDSLRGEKHSYSISSWGEALTKGREKNNKNVRERVENPADIGRGEGGFSIRGQDYH